MRGSRLPVDPLKTNLGANHNSHEKERDGHTHEHLHEVSVLGRHLPLMLRVCVDCSLMFELL